MICSPNMPQFVVCWTLPYRRTIAMDCSRHPIAVGKSMGKTCTGFLQIESESRGWFVNVVACLRFPPPPKKRFFSDPSCNPLDYPCVFPPLAHAAQTGTRLGGLGNSFQEPTASLSGFVSELGYYIDNQGLTQVMYPVQHHVFFL